MAKSRLEHIRAMIAGAEERMLNPDCSDQNFAVLGRLRRDLLAEVDELDPQASAGGPKTGLSDFERKLRERQSSSSASRRSKSG